MAQPVSRHADHNTADACTLCIACAQGGCFCCGFVVPRRVPHHTLSCVHTGVQAVSLTPPCPHPTPASTQHTQCFLVAVVTVFASLGRCTEITRKAVIEAIDPVVYALGTETEAEAIAVYNG
jgi:hypothetical protein